MLNKYSFRKMVLADLPMVQRWLLTPAVREWWIDADGQPADPIEEEDLGRSAVTLWIVSHAKKPFAFIQDYDPHAWPDHHFGHLPPRSRGIDQLIGNPAMIGQGHGSAFIREHVATLASFGTPVVGTDPHPANTRAIRAYEKAGFAKEGEVVTAWGPSLLMTCSTGGGLSAR